VRSAEIEKYKAKPVIVVCEGGNRSDKLLRPWQQGFAQVSR